ncbi:hypothetical protein ACFSUD_13135 [Sulfitobacter aestuarii]|uniref:Uncharacterized protein n=1 Tax=Sulfitobacter aestuarii TaxID=2161676 RepID=A0ABW5U4J7_9RHOB
MAIASFLIGGIAGVLAFLGSLLLLDTSFLAALGLYMGVGTAVSLLSLCIAMLAQSRSGETAETARAPASA